MSNPHIIRLRGPWQYEPLARTLLLPSGEVETEGGDLPPPGRIQMPADWGDSLGPDFRGRVRYQRRFGSPTGLSSGDRVELVVEAVDARGRVSVNGTSLGEIYFADPPARFDITARLLPSNLLIVEVELPRLSSESPPLPRPGRDGLPGGLIGEVRLEIFDLD